MPAEGDTPLPMAMEAATNIDPPQSIFADNVTVCTSPIIVGGTAGSGTRGAVTLLKKMGVMMLYDLASYDVEIGDWPKLVRDVLTHTNGSLMYNLGSIPAPVCDRVLSQLRSHFGTYKNLSCIPIRQNGVRLPLWGFKVPASIFFLPFWEEIFPDFIFVHAVRDGRDMPFSRNTGDAEKHLFDLFPDEFAGEGEAKRKAIVKTLQKLPSHVKNATIAGTRARSTKRRGRSIIRIKQLVYEEQKLPPYQPASSAYNLLLTGMKHVLKVWNKTNVEALGYAQKNLEGRYHVVHTQSLTSAIGFFQQALSLFNLVYRVVDPKNVLSRHTCTGSRSNGCGVLLTSAKQDRDSLGCYLYEAFLRANSYGADVEHDYKRILCCIAQNAIASRREVAARTADSYNRFEKYATNEFIAHFLNVHASDGLRLFNFSLDAQHAATAQNHNDDYCAPLLLHNNPCKRLIQNDAVGTRPKFSQDYPFPGMMSGGRVMRLPGEGERRCNTFAFTNETRQRGNDVVHHYLADSFGQGALRSTKRACCLACRNIEPLCNAISVTTEKRGHHLNRLIKSRRKTRQEMERMPQFRQSVWQRMKNLFNEDAVTYEIAKDPSADNKIITTCTLHHSLM